MNYSQAIEQQAAMCEFALRGGGLSGLTLVGYTPNGTTEEDAKSILFGACKTMLKSADPFYWDTTACDLVASTAPDMPSMSLRPEDLIALNGFCWFARPMPLFMPDGVDLNLPMLGYAWGAVTDRGVMLIPFVPSEKRVSGAPSQMIMWAYGDSVDQLVESVNDLASKDDEHLVYRDVHAIRRAEQLRYIAACMVFMNQRILVRHGEPVARSARRRLERSGWTHEPLIQVIKLRRAHVNDTPHDRDGEPVEWSCRWIVSGHWRQQFYPSTGEHRPVFVLPYIKGPEDKPLKPQAERVFAVVR